MKYKSIVWLFALFALLLTSCGYRIAIESANTTTTTTTTTTTSPQRRTTTTTERPDDCTLSNYEEMQEIRREVFRTGTALNEDFSLTNSRAFQDALLKYWWFVMAKNLPTMTAEQNALYDAISEYVKSIDRYWESGRQNRSYVDYLSQYTMAEMKFFSAFLWCS